MAELKLKNIKKIYPNGFEAVKDFSMDIDDKEFIVLVGPSGCGKSTSLRMIAGLEEISGGQLYIGEKLVNEVTPKNRDIAMVFQNYALYPHMTVYDNMAFGLKLRKRSKAEIKEKVNNAAKILGIEDLLNRKPKQLSGGQKQRVALGRAIVREPKVFLMDEPLSNLDAKLRVQMRAEIIKLHHKLKTTFIYVTHDQTEAMTMGTRIVVMKDGVVQQIDDPQTIYRHPANKFVGSFIGSPQMNFIDSKIIEANGKLYYEIKNKKIEIEEDRAKILRDKLYIDKIVTLGLRPDAIEVRDKNDSLEAVVDVTEMLGSEMYLYLDFDGNNVTVKVDPSYKVEIGKKINFGFKAKKVHLFDSETEMSIL
ncbi:sn-glycerol-3-phosphate ABC transporter ATP-binding protein UgpC [Clostridiaceae bacterium M8S5]|nr:sn-glycerol-3-phosphate ABC transporter ATP-binding protein UgpC [Clostridiaceae bacterium M8S5]